MDNGIVATGLTSALFLGSHLGLSSATVRGWLVGRFGEQRFLGLYSLIALLTLVVMSVAYAQASHHLYLWPPGPGVRHLPLLFMPVAFFLIAGGVLIPNPSAVGMEGRLGQEEPATGVLRITRHPMMWGILVWAMAHILANGDQASLLFFGGFLLTALLGSLHLDRRMVATQGERWQRVVAVTSYLPFAAILAGRQTLRWAELRWPAALGLGLFVLLLLLHQSLFGVRPY
jgi:uncharacterized membrane protein